MRGAYPQVAKLLTHLPLIPVIMPSEAPATKSPIHRKLPGTSIPYHCTIATTYSQYIYTTFVYNTHDIIDTASYLCYSQVMESFYEQTHNQRYIYVLIDLLDKVFYVGSTTNPKGREREHRKNFNYMKSFEIVEVISPVGYAKAEHRWIRKMIDEGNTLINNDWR